MSVKLRIGEHGMRGNYGFGPCHINYAVITTNRGQFTTFYHLNGQPSSNFALSNFEIIPHDVPFLWTTR